jgi:UDP-glucose 4-epimerase
MDGFNSLVTGGAGFIGGHLVSQLIGKGWNVAILDNFSGGKLANIETPAGSPAPTVFVEDLKKPKKLNQIVKNCEIVFHLAANPEVRVGTTDPKIHFEENILATFNLLNAIRQTKRVKAIVFTSTSTVYGEALEVPTPENYGPLIPISTYGATKLACEALITSYAYTFNLRALILRLANIVGPGSDHGVTVDFINKIAKNPESLKILGDGRQEKSYLHITDCIDAIVHSAKRFLKNTERVDIFNVGSRDRITVKEIAEIIAEEMGARDIRHKYTGGVEGGRGWLGDVKTMQLCIDKLLQCDWQPKFQSEQAVRMAARALLAKKKPSSKNPQSS